ncbi:MAG: NAD(P)H-dependent oxidoreductase [Gammaproteobacteria bacterium]|nr:NAD(P)H-dependent oxidoreductase [Gammaproteobacteria bacterium]
MSKKILVILGQPQRNSYGGALAQAYIEGARAAGAEVREIYLGDLRFDACPASGAPNPAGLEPDLARAQESIKWAEHLVFVYPIWWGTIPALLKGFVERVFLPGFAVNFRDNSPLWDKLLKGRSARLIVTLNTPSWIYRWYFGRPGHNTMKKTILQFCGVSPVRITEVGPIKNSTDAKRKQWLDQVRALGARLA